MDVQSIMFRWIQYMNNPQQVKRKAFIKRKPKLSVIAERAMVPYVPRGLPKAPRAPRKQEGRAPRTDQVGSVVRSRIVRTGVSDIKRLRLSWVAGYTYVGNGTNGLANTVYFRTASNGSRWLATGSSNICSGQAPIASSDLDLGASYVSDIEKHFSRKVIRRMWVHIDSLQPSTSNNMVMCIGFTRGSGGLGGSLPSTAAGSTAAGNTFANVMSMRGSFPVDSWEHQTVDISEFIAGGTGPQQNEFDVGQSNANTASIWATNNTYSLVDGDLLIPACFAVAGNNTTAGLQGTNVHQITFEQEVDLLDYTGAMFQINPAD